MRKSPFPYRAILIGALLSVLVALYSAYAGLKMGGVYWPMVTTAVVSLALVRAFSLGGKQETNVMQTAASTGGLLAAGVIFTIPALFMLGLQVGAMDILLVSLTGGMLGLLFVYPLRQRMVVEEKLPYADGAFTLIVCRDAGDTVPPEPALALSASRRIDVVTRCDRQPGRREQGSGTHDTGTQHTGPGAAVLTSSHESTGIDGLRLTELLVHAVTIIPDHVPFRVRRDTVIGARNISAKSHQML